MAIAPRPYGVGPYGVGPYERYSGTIHDCAGASSIVWATRAATRNVVPMRARADLTFALTSILGKTIDLGGARSDLVFDAIGLGLQRIVGVEATADLVFDAFAESRWTWDETGACPCDTGEWVDADSCGAGAWTPPGAGGTGAWLSGDSVPPGVWTPLAGCNTGAWSRP